MELPTEGVDADEADSDKRAWQRRRRRAPQRFGVGLFGDDNGRERVGMRRRRRRQWQQRWLLGHL